METPTLPQPFARALAQTLDALRADPMVEAVFLGGSAALGLCSARSDLDLVVIKNEQVPVMERYARYEGEVQVQVIAGPPRQFDLWLETDKPQGTVVRQLAGGQLLFDRAGVGAQYRARAQEVVARGLEPMSEPQIRSRRFVITELLDDVADCSEDVAQLRWLMNTSLLYVIETAFLWHRRWTPKGKRAMSEIEALDPGLARLCRDYLDATEWQAQREAFMRLAHYCLAPLGGELREAWTRPPERVSGTDSAQTRD